MYEYISYVGLVRFFYYQKDKWRFDTSWEKLYQIIDKVAVFVQWDIIHKDEVRFGEQMWN